MREVISVPIPWADAGKCKTLAGAIATCVASNDCKGIITGDKRLGKLQFQYPYLLHWPLTRLLVPTPKLTIPIAFPIQRKYEITLATWKDLKTKTVSPNQSSKAFFCLNCYLHRVCFLHRTQENFTGFQFNSLNFTTSLMFWQTQMSLLVCWVSVWSSKFVLWYRRRIWCYATDLIFWKKGFQKRGQDLFRHSFQIPCTLDLLFGSTTARKCRMTYLTIPACCRYRFPTFIGVFCRQSWHCPGCRLGGVAVLIFSALTSSDCLSEGGWGFDVTFSFLSLTRPGCY